MGETGGARAGAFLIRGGMVYDPAAGAARRADILTRGAVIERIAPGIPPEAGAAVIDAAGKTAYPGFIDGHSHIGTLFQFPDSDECNECSNPATPALRITDAFDCCDPCLLQNARAGVTTAMITPGSGNAVCGKAAVVKTWAPGAEAMIAREYAALKIAFGENPKSVYMPLKRLPMSRMGTASVVSGYLERARRYAEKREAGGDADFEYEPALPVLRGEIPLKIHCHRADDILTAIRIAKRFGVRFTLDHCTEGHLILDEIERAGAPVFLGPLFLFKTKPELRNADPFSALKYAGRGIPFSLISDHNVTDSRFLGVWAGELVKGGMSRADALRALTINPARAIGMGDRLGSLEAGKDADLFLADGDPLELRTRVTFTMIGGQAVPMGDAGEGGTV